MKLSRFNTFKKINENTELETEVKTDVESNEFTKLQGIKSDKVTLNGLNFNIDDNIKFIFDDGYVIFNIDESTDSQTQLSVLDTTIDKFKVGKDYMIYNKDIFKDKDTKFYFDFASENNKWLKNLTISGLDDVDIV